jgi:alcohol dehydrogenase class IV
MIGPGIIDQAPEYLQPASEAAGLLIVAPGEPWVEPLVERLANQMKAAGWARTRIFAEVEPNPTWNVIEQGTVRGQEVEASAILGIGGGSSMDASKVIAERCEVDYLMTVPTTAGTGGEISPWAVITNLDTREKESVQAKWPDIALLDPELTLTLPPKITLFTGIDAFTHGLEAYLSTAANPITDALALGGIELIASHLRVAVEKGENLDARRAMLEGSLLTGASMLNAGLGLMHAISNVAGGLYHQVPHGLILFRCMDAVLEYNRPVITHKLSRLEAVIRQVEADAAAFIEDVEMVISRKDLPLLAARAAENVNALTNPRPAKPKEVESLIEKAFRMR